MPMMSSLATCGIELVHWLPDGCSESAEALWSLCRRLMPPLRLAAARAGSLICSRERLLKLFPAIDTLLGQLRVIGLNLPTDAVYRLLHDLPSPFAGYSWPLHLGHLAGQGQFPRSQDAVDHPGGGIALLRRGQSGDDISHHLQQLAVNNSRFGARRRAVHPALRRSVLVALVDRLCSCLHTPVSLFLLGCRVQAVGNGPGQVIAEGGHAISRVIVGQDGVHYAAHLA